METVMQRRAAKSREEGRMEGDKNRAILTAKGMLREGIDLAVIARVLDMPVSVIRQWLEADSSVQLKE